MNSYIAGNYTTYCSYCSLIYKNVMLVFFTIKMCFFNFSLRVHYLLRLGTLSVTNSSHGEPGNNSY